MKEAQKEEDGEAGRGQHQKEREKEVEGVCGQKGDKEFVVTRERLGELLVLLNSRKGFLIPLCKKERRRKHQGLQSESDNNASLGCPGRRKR